MLNKNINYLINLIIEKDIDYNILINSSKFNIFFNKNNSKYILDSNELLLFYTSLLSNINTLDINELKNKKIENKLKDINFDLLLQYENKIKTNIFFQSLQLSLISILKKINNQELLFNIAQMEFINNTDELKKFINEEIYNYDKWFCLGKPQFWKSKIINIQELNNCDILIEEYIKKKTLKKKLYFEIYNNKNIEYYYMILFYKELKEHLLYDSWLNIFRYFRLNTIELLNDKEVDFILSVLINFFNKTTLSESKKNKLIIQIISYKDKEKMLLRLSEINHLLNNVFNYHCKVKKITLDNIIHDLKTIETKQIYSGINIKELIPDRILNMDQKEVFFLDNKFKCKVYYSINDVILKGEEYKNCLSQFSFIERLLIGDIFLVTFYNEKSEILLGINYKFELEEVESTLPLDIEILKENCNELLLIF